MLKNQARNQTDPAGNPKVSSTADRMQKLEAELKKFQDLAAENLRGWQRARADYQNLMKQSAEEHAELVKCSNEQLILEILPVLDHFDQAQKHLPAKLASEEWVKGVLLLKTQLENILAAQGVETIDALGQIFDPEKHEAITQVKGNPAQHNTVVEEIQRGYEYQGKLLRAAKVKVGS